jgi:ankyrin repeat protein
MRFNFKKVIYLFIVICFSSVHAGSYEDFFRAVNIDNDRTVRSLLASGFDPNTRDERGQVGLFLAMREGSPKVATALLAHPDIKVDAANAVGETPLMMAALRGNLEWSQRLIERGGQLSRDGWTPLHYAASGPEPKVVALLLDRGAPIDALSPNRTTPLMMAARYGDEASADLLLARGADAKLRNDPGLSAADFARLAGREALAERLERRAR